MSLAGCACVKNAVRSTPMSRSTGQVFALFGVAAAAHLELLFRLQAAFQALLLFMALRQAKLIFVAAARRLQVRAEEK